MLGVFGVVRSSMQSAPAQTDQAAARVPLENYIQGHATGNGDFMRKAFHPDAKVVSFRDGKMSSLTAEEFASRFNGNHPTVTFTDYMSLLKVGDEWKIVNKVFYAEPKTKP